MAEILDIENITKKYVAGASLKNLAKECGVSQPTIAKALREHGVEIRSRGRQKKNSFSEVSTSETKPENVKVTIEQDNSYVVIKPADGLGPVT